MFNSKLEESGSSLFPRQLNDKEILQEEDGKKKKKNVNKARDEVGSIIQWN